MRTLSFFACWVASWILTVSAFGAGSWNGVAVTGWNGVAITAWNSTGVSAAGGGGGGGFNTSGLLIWADFIGDVVNDANPGTNNGTAVNTPTYVNDPWSVASSAILCEGGSIDRSVKWTDDASLEMTDDFSFVLWMRSDSGGAVGPVVAKYSAAPNLSFALEWQGAANDRFIARYTDDGTTLESEVTGANYPDDNSWMHIACVFDESADQMKIYKNGTLTTTLTWSTETGAWVNTTSSWRIGCFVNDTSAAHLAVARFSLWSRVLDSTEITTLYNSGLDVKFSDLSGL